MIAALSLVLAAAVAQTAPADQPHPHGASVSVRATVEILRGETNSEAATGEGLNRHVGRPEPGRVTIEFE